MLCLVNILQKKGPKQEENEEIPWCKINLNLNFYFKKIIFPEMKTN